MPDAASDATHAPSHDATPDPAGAATADTTAPPVVAPLALRVHCGDLRFVRAPVLVGHYRSTHLTGSELALDKVLRRQGERRGELQRALDLGAYVEGPRTNAIFRNRHLLADNPWAVPAPEAVIVVGLGEEGTLRLPGLAETVRQGVLAWAMRLAAEPGETPATFALCATLVGSGGTGIDVHGAAQAVARGVADAQAALVREGRLGDGTGADRRPHPLPHVTALTIVEVYLSRASEAWRALRALQGAEPERFTLDDTVASGTGAITRPPEEGYRGASYDFVQVVTEESRARGAVLAFRLDTRRARNELREQQLQPPLVRHLVADATHAEAVADPALGRTLFSLLVPLGLRTYLSTATEFVLGVDAGSAALPWELMHDGGEDGGARHEPWAIRARVVRKFLVPSFREQPRDAARDAHALVVGDPTAPADRFDPLPAARVEARTVASRLGAGLPGGRERVTLLVPDDGPRGTLDATRVMNALFARPYRIMHIAAHGVAPESPEEAQAARGPDAVPAPRGIALSEGTFLGTGEIAQLPVVPELVFLNCCYLGRGEDGALLAADRHRPHDRPGFAAGVAQRLIEAGVKCVVACGWTVSDDGARIFAETFYDALLGDGRTNGARFADAVVEARRAAWRHDPLDTTWAAYQCYGDPDWRLVERRADGTGNRADERRIEEVASARGFGYLLEELAVRAEHGDSDDRTRVRAQLERYARALRPAPGDEPPPVPRLAWGAIGDVCEAMGRAFMACGDAESAVTWYEHATATADGTASFRAVEQLANARTRRAWARVHAELGDRPPKPGSRRAKALSAAADAARDDLDAAVRALRALVDIAPTVERCSLVGAAGKRRAMIARATGDADAELAALHAMRAAYQDAERLGAADGVPDAYPAQNRLVADAALAGRGVASAAVDVAAFDAVQAMMERRNRDAPDFWSVVGLIELEILRAVLDGTLDVREAALVADLAEVQSRCSGPRLWRSVADNWRFVLGGTPAADAPGHALLAALEDWARG